MSLVILVLTSTSLIAEGNDMAQSFQRLKSALTPLDLNSPVVPNETEAYLKFYSLSFEGVKHSMGTIRSGSELLAVQLFQVKESKGTVVLSHGYYDHAGVLKNLIRSLVDQDYTVVVFDHIGHGLSTGVPASINDFKDYVDGLTMVIQFCGENLVGPIHLVGHSMGCAIILDSLLTGDELPVDRIVLLAPLVRSKAWKASGVGLKLLGRKFDSVPRKFRRNSSDESFLKFHKEDPLQARSVPMTWVTAHLNWCNRMLSGDTCEKKITIIQGTKDSTVDWGHNLKFLKQRIPQSEIVMIKGAGHQLMNESREIRQTVIKGILQRLVDPRLQ